MEVELKRLKRFDQNKHEQLEGLLQWCTLMGLTGKDLISLGGHIDRMQARNAAKANLDIVDGMGCQPVGQDKNMIGRWKFKTAQATYRFEETSGWYSVKITNTSTKAKKTVLVNHTHDIGRMHYRKQLRYLTMLDVYHGKIQLNF